MEDWNSDHSNAKADCYPSWVSCTIVTFPELAVSLYILSDAAKRINARYPTFERDFGNQIFAFKDLRHIFRAGPFS